jgi:hypothetical protein
MNNLMKLSRQLALEFNGIWDLVNMWDKEENETEKALIERDLQDTVNDIFIEFLKKENRKIELARSTFRFFKDNKHLNSIELNSCHPKHPYKLYTMKEWIDEVLEELDK